MTWMRVIGSEIKPASRPDMKGHGRESFTEWSVASIVICK